MRVDYTLPSLQPEAFPEMPVGIEAPSSFRDHLNALNVELPQDWSQQLRLDVRPFTGTYISPPPLPSTLSRGDPETERARWRGMLSRHSQPVTAASQSVGANGRQPVQGMLAMLLEMQDMEDAIVSRSVGVTRG